MVGLDQQRRVFLAPPGIAPRRQGAQRVAVIALTPGDQAVPLGRPRLQMILPRQLDRGLDRFGPAGQQIDPVDPLGRLGNQQIGQVLGRLGGEEPGMGKGHLVQLAMDRRPDIGIGMAKAGHRRAARAVQIRPPLGVEEITALAPHCRRQPPGAAPEDMAHRVSLPAPRTPIAAHGAPPARHWGPAGNRSARAGASP